MKYGKLLKRERPILHNKDISESADEHFKKRAGAYNNSSNWVDDDKLINLMFDNAKPLSNDRVLDLAVGTGKVSGVFKGKVAKVTGLDISSHMAEQAKDNVDDLVYSKAEKMPFDDATFDICVCRQGLQFMDVSKVLSEVYRVLTKGGRVVFCHLTAYSDQDKETTFKIQQYRNPARKNFFMPEDFDAFLKQANFSDIELTEYISIESVSKWINNGAIPDSNKLKIIDLYKNSSEEFRSIHSLNMINNDIYDSMKFVIAKGVKG